MADHHNLDFASVQVRDLAKSRAFYTDVLNFQPTDEARPDAVVFKNSAGAIFAIRVPLQPLPEEGPLGTGASFWFAVDDVEALHQQIVTGGGTVIAPPQDGPFGRQMTLRDPDGYVIVLHQMPNA